MEVPCDPGIESCFVFTCDPQVDAECVGDGINSYYKFIYKKASLMPTCNDQGLDCGYPTCKDDDTCEETVCNPEEVGDGEVCDVL